MSIESLTPEDIAKYGSEADKRELAMWVERMGGNGKTPEWHKCAKDPAYWIDTYCWTYNPKLDTDERWMRFRLFPRQFELIQWLQDREQNREPGLIEKSREVGVSWLVMAYMAHHWLFQTGFKGGAGSRVEDLVDKLGDPDSLFEKVRLMFDRLPEWMLPKGYSRDKCLRFMKFSNPENGSVLTGESGDNIGRGGRNSLYFVDESAFVEHQDKVEAALSHNCDCIIDGSTVNGNGNTFYRKRFSGSVPVFIFDWRDDPRKNDEWYAAMQARYAHNPALMASEVDRDYSASIEGVVIPGAWVQAAINADTRYGWKRFGAIHAAADIAAGGANLTVFGARQGPCVFGLNESKEGNTTTNTYNLRDKTREVRAVELHYDALGVGIASKSIFDLEVDDRGKSKLGFKTDGILGGERPSFARWPDGNSSQELFVNRRAELYWMLRDRFRKTFEMANGATCYEPEEMISIPFHAELISQLSMPLMQRASNGKIKIESKDDMKKRGIKSPDWADMTVYLFAPEALAPFAATTTQTVDQPSPMQPTPNVGHPRQAQPAPQQGGLLTGMIQRPGTRR